MKQVLPKDIYRGYPCSVVAVGCPLAREDGGACQLADVRTSDKERPKGCPLVEIVTCEHCKSECTEKNGEKFSETRPNFFCADAERKEQMDYFDYLWRLYDKMKIDYYCGRIDKYPPFPIWY